MTLYTFLKLKKTVLILLFCGIVSVIALFFNWTRARLPDVTIVGPIKLGDGIGRQSVELMDMLYKDLHINCIPTKTPHFTDVPPHIAALIKRSNKKLGKVVIYEESLPTPNEKFYKCLNRFIPGPKNQEQIRIASSVIESSRIPPLWAEALNDCFDAVVVPDLSLVETYQNSGVTTPIFVLPLGLNLSSFLQHPLKAEAHTPFCFINASSLIPRKNHLGLIEAFYKAFGDDPHVILLLNYRSTAGGVLSDVQKLIDSLHVHNIILKSDKLDNAHYLDFFLKGDAFVSLSKGEGFSIQPREAMALGLPVIVSENTAHKTIINSGLVCAVPCPHTEEAYNPYLKCTCGEEYSADVDAAAAALRSVYEHYHEHLAKSSRRRAWAAQYQFENLKSLYLNLVHPQRVVLGDHNEITQDALITTSQDLYNKYQKLLPLYPNNLKNWHQECAENSRG